MFNFFNKHRRSVLQQQQQLNDLNDKFKYLDNLKKSGLLSYDEKLRRLYVDETLVTLFMSTPGAWKNFMTNIFNWLFLKESSKAYTEFFLQEEIDAVRKEKKKYAMLTRADIQRIKDARRAEIQQSDMPEIKPKPFEFFVLRHELSAKEQEVPGAEILIVGDYDGENKEMSMADWQDVQKFLNRE